METLAHRYNFGALENGERCVDSACALLSTVAFRVYTVAAMVICNQYIVMALHAWCAGGRSEFIQLELDMFRMTALFVVERNKAQLLGELFKLLKLSAQAARSTAGESVSCRIQFKMFCL